MRIMKENIDFGKAFDWGKTSADYAKYRDIYPKEFYQKIADRGLCTREQKVLDLGTGTGVLPRNMYSYGAKWVGTDASKKQIEWAKRLSVGMDIDYFVLPAEDIDFAENSFDAITACQCFWYFDHEKLAPKLWTQLKPGGYFLLLVMEWLPFEDEIAGMSEELVLKYSPKWSGAHRVMHPIEIPDCYNRYFDTEHHEEYRIKVPFTRESWNGRMKACRGIGASLSDAEIAEWESEHLKLLSQKAPEKFEVLHYAAMAALKAKNNVN